MHAHGADGVLICRHCGSSTAVSKISGLIEVRETISKKCPSCATALTAGRLEGNPVSFCATCEGMLIAMDQFVSVIEAVRAHEEPARTVSPRKQTPGDRTIICPGCGTPMLNHFYGGPGNVVLDTCEHCRLNWLDPGELCRIARAPEARAISSLRTEISEPESCSPDDRPRK
jgi:Zn-finger nucleic acid-binding protein